MARRPRATGDEKGAKAPPRLRIGNSVQPPNPGEARSGSRPEDTEVTKEEQIAGHESRATQATRLDPRRDARKDGLPERKRLRKRAKNRALGIGAIWGSLRDCARCIADLESRSLPLLFLVPSTFRCGAGRKTRRCSSAAVRWLPVQYLDAQGRAIWGAPEGRIVEMPGERVSPHDADERSDAACLCS